MRTFIQYDGDGEVIAVVQTEALPAGLEHPFYLEDETHGVLELNEGDETARRPGTELGLAFKVDVATRRLVEKSAPKRTTGESTKKEATTKASATKAPTTNSATKTLPKKAVAKAATKKASTKKAATKKGKRPSGSK
jgi:hypothetical protein